MAKKITPPKSGNYIIDCRVYPFDIMFSLGESDDELYKVLEERNIQDLADNFHVCKLSGVGRCVQLPGNKILVRTKYYPVSCDHYGTLQHEILHAVTFLMEIVGMSFNSGCNDEAWAYMIGFLTTELYRKINFAE